MPPSSCSSATATSTTAPAAVSGEPVSDRVGGVETRGIDLVPDSERHGRPRQLFAVWAAPNVSYLSFVVGATLVIMGLTLPQAIGVIMVGNLLWICTGVAGVSGPVAGTSGSVVSRAVYGVVGNKFVMVATGWLIAAAYLALNWSAASVASLGLTRQMGLPGSPTVKAVVTCCIAGATILIAIFGHSTIMRLYRALSIFLAVVFLVVAGHVLANANWSYAPAEPLRGTGLVVALTAGFTIIASTALSYSNSPDLARYLPRDSSPFAIAGWTALGAYLPSVFFTGVGALAATALDMNDPQTALESVLPVWFIPLFVIGVVFNTLANNGMTAYSAGLCVQAVGVPVKRIPAVLVIGLLGTAMTLYATLISDFLTSVNTMLQLVVVVTGPAMAVMVTDIVLRRNRYNGADLLRQRRGGPYWYHNGVHVPGIAALLLGAVASLLCVNTSFWTGQLSSLLSDFDLAIPAGMGTAVVVYLVATRAMRTIPRG